MTTESPCLAADSVTFSAGGRRILAGAYLDAVRGTVTALVGRTGAGKTTLLEIIVGRRKPDSGQVRWEGAHIRHATLAALARRGLVYLPDHLFLLRSLPAATQLDLASKIGQRDWHSAAGQLGPTDCLYRQAGALSGGELRIAQLLFALALGPRVLVADEPFRGLAPLHREFVSGVFRSLADQGVAVLFADHDARLVLSTADRLFSLEDGSTRAIAEFQGRPLEEWYAGWPPAATTDGRP